MPPMAKAIVSRVSPKARATPRKPMPRCPAPGSPAGKAAARRALPHPPNTNQKVPKNSAAARLPIDIASSQFVLVLMKRMWLRWPAYDDLAELLEELAQDKVASHFTIARPMLCWLVGFLLPPEQKSPLIALGS